MEHIISKPLWGLHNLAYDNVNPAMVNMYDIMSCNALDFIGKAQFEKINLDTVTAP